MGQVVVTSERALGAGPDPADDRLVEQDAYSSMVTTWEGALAKLSSEPGT